MSAENEQRGLFSRLPDDPAYWQDLTDRIVDDGLTRIAEIGADRPAWWSEMARYSGMLAVGATAAVLAIVFLMPRAGAVEPQGRSMDTYGLIPRDPLALTLAREDSPPTIETLIALMNSEQLQ